MKPETQSDLPSDKATQDANTAERIAILEELILRGSSRRDVDAIIAKKFSGWRLTPQQITDLLETAISNVAAIRPDLDLETAKAAQRLQQLYAKTILIQDYKTALATQKTLNQLLSLSTASTDPNIRAMQREL